MCILQDMSLIKIWNNFSGFTYVGAFFTSLIFHFFPPLMLPKIKPSIATTVLIPLSVNGEKT